MLSMECLGNSAREESSEWTWEENINKRKDSVHFSYVIYTGTAHTYTYTILFKTQNIHLNKYVSISSYG